MWGISLTLWKNQMHLICKMSVCLFSAWGTHKLLYTLQAKKNPPMASCAVACCTSVASIWDSSFRMQHGKAFCCFAGGSLLLYALNCLEKIIESSPSSLREGFPLSLSLKVAATYEMAFQIVLSDKVSYDGPENRASCMAWVNPPSTLMRWNRWQ